MLKKRTEMKVDIGKAVKASLIGIPVAIILFILLFFVIKGFDKTYYKGMSRKMYFTVSDEGRILRGNYNGKAVYSKGMSNIYFLKTDADHVSLEVALEKEKVVFEEIDGFELLGTESVAHYSTEVLAMKKSITMVLYFMVWSVPGRIGIYQMDENGENNDMYPRYRTE